VEVLQEVQPDGRRGSRREPLLHARLVDAAHLRTIGTAVSAIGARAVAASVKPGQSA
jgi:hypothetical protein